MINRVHIFGFLLMLGLTNTLQAQPPRHGGPGNGPERRVLFPRRHEVRPPAGAIRFSLGGVLYFVFNDIYYRAMGDHFIIVPAPTLSVLPPKAKPVVIAGITYYILDDIYYRHGPRGYVIVEKPVLPEPAKPIKEDPKSDQIIIKIPKKDGTGEIPVILTRRKQGGYLGPKGEFYWLLPSITTLQKVYDTSATTPQVSSSEGTLILHVPNKDAEGFTPVILTRMSTGFLGPQGEFYPQMPKISLLTELYGQVIVEEEASDNTLTLYVPNLNGEGFTPVTLTIADIGYLGPQGEFYPNLPSIQVLSEIYGVQ